MSHESFVVSCRSLRLQLLHPVFSPLFSHQFTSKNLSFQRDLNPRRLSHLETGINKYSLRDVVAANTLSNLEWHREVVEMIVQELKRKFDTRSPFNLPEQTREGALYQPDIVAFERESKELRCVVEVQTTNVRKSIAGATILAEICVPLLERKSRPQLFFVVRDDSDEHELEKLRRRIQLIREALKQPWLESVQILRKREFLPILRML